MRSSEEITRTVLIVIGSIILTLFAIIPFIWMMIVSFFQDPYFLHTGDMTAGWMNYYDVLTTTEYNFPQYFQNSIIISLTTAVVVSFISALSGYAVSRMRFPGRQAVPLFALAMSMFPQVCIVGFLYNTFAGWGWLNTYQALILPYISWTVPIALWINMSYFQQIPLELDKAALVDGAGRLKIIFSIILPIALPGMFSAFLLVFLAAFNEFLFALMLTRDATVRTITVGIAFFQGYMGQVPWGHLMAASAIAAVPLVTITVIFQRYVVAGLAGGAVKG